MAPRHTYPRTTNRYYNTKQAGDEMLHLLPVQPGDPVLDELDGAALDIFQ